MPYDLSERLVIGLASSALFDLAESDQVFREQGEAIYRTYQRDNEDVPLEVGVAFPFIKRLLSLNDLSPDNPPIEVMLLSRNDPETGLRVMKSIEHHGLGITRAIFLQGRYPHRFIPALNISLFLSANKQDVDQAILAGHPAGQVLSSGDFDLTDEEELRIAFDFDGVLVTDESETIYQQQGIEAFREYERTNAQVPAESGLLADFLRKLARIQALEKRCEEQTHGRYHPKVRVSIVTARNAPAHERVIHTMRSWGVTVNEAYFLGGVAKEHVLGIIKPHIFFDDQASHLSATSDILPSVHVPFGQLNQGTKTQV
ncbi:5'-nucleotidase [Litchfieldella anticariensis FP35 = DSM 16096]|uniref:5'-nucleotidase n=1 Tax=Litchfieldella anticariensis (strain DSM 16096 / CECT 5854 / CIP 108499 / LMG 22089 / FP35) TaxID=1121939 RepID=S2L3Q2_LITA3|nr:5'-nucleotidase [Halomonas anticariensis]EPC02364.1 5'-nucleotidase [Halomonas anticariensis FP35 = DSM 16096]